MHVSLLVGVVMSGASMAPAQEDQPVNVAPFGEITKWDNQGKDYGVTWEDARDVFRVVVVFADAAAAPKPDQLHLEYWQSSWPQRRIPRDQASGAGSSGWLDVGDWFNGKWRTADVKIEVNGPTYTFTFNPINAKEFSDLGDFAATYRTTFKLRLVGEAPLPAITSLEAYSDSVYKPLEFEIEWGGTAEQEQVWDGRLEVFNGVVESIALLSAGKGDPSKPWRSKVSKGQTDGIAAKVLYAETKAYNSFDETVVTLRAARETFSFAATDLAKGERIFMPDFGVLVRKAGDKTTYAEAHRQWGEARKKNKDLYSRVSDVPEQTFTQAWNDTPAKDPHEIPLSFEGGRQHFGVRENGEVFSNKNWISRIRGKDTDRCQWQGDTINYRFGLPATRPVERGLVDGYLPMIVAVWEREGVRYRQTAFVIPLMGVPNAGERIQADDTLVLMARIEMEKTGPADAGAGLGFTINHGDKDEKLGLHEGRIITVAQKPEIRRMRVTSPDPSDQYALAEEDGRIAYRAKLTGNAPKRTLEVAIPYVTLSDPGELAQLETLKFDQAFSAVRAYWQARVQAGTQIQTPEPMINDFYRAQIIHLLINIEREVGKSDRYMTKVGTFHYGAFCNESVMMLDDLDRRGYHELTERALESWLHYQGTVGLPGHFSTKDGQFYGAGGYEMGGYNQHHGWVLHGLGEHYFVTRDAAWLEHAAPYIVKGCDWIINERRLNTEEANASPIRAIERGLMPPGRLEDIGDFRCWLSTNVYTWWGMSNTAKALAAIGHPDGQRLLGEAEAYRKDVVAAFTEAMRRSPVVRLRDGSWIPHVPPDVHRRGRSFGWITETLEGAIHLVRTEMIDPNDRIATWIIQDFEDNLYLSKQYGYDLTGKDFDRYWFSRGGISMQANLLHNPIPYLLRDEPKHFLRAYFNAFAVSFFPDTRMMTEHALPNIGDWRGDHYKSSDEANSTYWLRCMFIQERGDELWLGAAIPRYWLTDGQKIGIERAATRFGPMSVRLESNVARGQITMVVDPPLRNPPKVIRARFRHPEGLRMKRCELDGQPITSFDPEKEWVELTARTGPTRIVAYYE